jgi:hypothetical protein
MMEAASTSEKSVNFYQTTRCRDPGDSHLYLDLFLSGVPRIWEPNHSDPLRSYFPLTDLTGSPVIDMPDDGNRSLPESSGLTKKGKRKKEMR